MTDPHLESWDILMRSLHGMVSRATKAHERYSLSLLSIFIFDCSFFVLNFLIFIKVVFSNFLFPFFSYSFTWNSFVSWLLSVILISNHFVLQIQFLDFWLLLVGYFEPFHVFILPCCNRNPRGIVDDFYSFYSNSKSFLFS
jgi:hypothetical protein